MAHNSFKQHKEPNLPWLNKRFYEQVHFSFQKMMINVTQQQNKQTEYFEIDHTEWSTVIIIFRHMEIYRHLLTHIDPNQIITHRHILTHINPYRQISTYTEKYREISTYTTNIDK